MMKKEFLATYLLVGAVAFVFLAFGIWEWMQPYYWAGFVPSFLATMVSSNTLVKVHGTVLILVALALLIPKSRRIAAVLGTLVMFEIVVSIWLDSGFTDPTLIRDIGILLAVTSLIFRETGTRVPLVAPEAPLAQNQLVGA